MSARPSVFRSEAHLHILQAVDWYEARQEGLGAELLDEIERVRPQIEALPLSFPVVTPKRPKRRRALLHRFPFALVFDVHDAVISVLALVHVKQRPRALKKGSSSP